jgi:hypothetical protein
MLMRKKRRWMRTMWKRSKWMRRNVSEAEE